MKKAIISAHEISIGYPKSKKHGENALYQNLSFKLYQGEFTCLLGANGAGKSTLLRTLTGLQPSLSGDIFLQQKAISKYSEKELASLLGLVLTDKTVSGGFTVAELVSLGRYPYTGFLGRLDKHDYDVVEKAISDVCIIHKSDSYVADLSDGERQKVMIAKALAQECPIIILDEPTAFLDVVNRIEIMNLLRYVAVSQNKTILLSTHDVELALLLADRIWLLASDKGLISGVTEDVILSNSVEQYLGKGSIVFDKTSGRFYSEPKLQQRIYLKTVPDLQYWSKNILYRNGFQPTDDKEEKLHISVLSADRIEVNNDKESCRFSSFEELDLWLKQNK